MRLFILSFLLPLFLLGARPEFKEGVSLYNQGAYWEALRIFAELAEEDATINPQQSASAYMRIRCYNKLGYVQRALMLARQFPLSYTESEYLDDLIFLTGEIYLNIGDPREAAWYFANSAATTKDRKIRKEARKYTESLVGTVCSESDLQALATKSIDRTGQYLALLVANRYLDEGKRGESLNILFNLRPYIQEEDLRKLAIQLYDNIGSSAVDTIHVAVVLPLSGSLSSIASPILSGIRYAAMKYMDSTDQAVQLHVYDNAGELSESIKIARRVRDNPKVIAQIGPLTNENVKGAAAVLASRHIPIIAPAATENDLTDLSESIFQFRATRERKAVALAEYAVTTLGLETFAIIAPSTEYGQQFADNFSSRVDELGGLIEYQGWYVGDPEDLSKNHFRKIREIGLEDLYLKMREDSLRLDSLLTGMITEGDSINIYEEQLRPILKKSRPTRSDSLKVELSHIDGIFFPIHKGSIPFIASQIAHNNLVTHVFGDENWLDHDILKKNARYLPQLTLVAGDRLGFQQIDLVFAEEYLQLFQHRPGQYDYMGFDVMGLLLSAAQYAGSSGDKLWEVLTHSPTYEGAVHQIQWGGDTKRENNLVFLMNYVDSAFELEGYFDNTGFFSMDSLRSDSIGVELPSEIE